jgi:hypothetical protein
MHTDDKPYPKEGWFEIRTKEGTLNLPEAYASTITTSMIDAIGIDPTCEFTITGQQQDGTTTNLGDFKGNMSFTLDPEFRIYNIEGVDGSSPCMDTVHIDGAFYKPCENPPEDHDPDVAPKTRSRMDFANEYHGRVYEYLALAQPPVDFSDTGLTFNRKHPTYKKKFRDFKKNAKKRFAIKDGHLVYNVVLRRRKKVARDIHLKLHPTKIIPFDDEVNEVQICHHNLRVIATV